MDEENTQVAFPPEIVETSDLISPSLSCNQERYHYRVDRTTLPMQMPGRNVNMKDLVAECENRGWTVYY